MSWATTAVQPQLRMCFSGKYNLKLCVQSIMEVVKEPNCSIIYVDDFCDEGLSKSRLQTRLNANMDPETCFPTLRQSFLRR